LVLLAGAGVLISIALHGVTVMPAMRWPGAKRHTQGVLPLEV